MPSPKRRSRPLVNSPGACGNMCGVIRSTIHLNSFDERGLSEHNPETELDLAAEVGLRCDAAEARVADRCVGCAKHRMIHRVECRRSEFGGNPLDDLEVLAERDVDI